MTLDEWNRYPGREEAMKDLITVPWSIHHRSPVFVYPKKFEDNDTSPLKANFESWFAKRSPHRFLSVLLVSLSVCLSIPFLSLFVILCILVFGGQSRLFDLAMLMN
jgi:hypothetical protein